MNPIVKNVALKLCETAPASILEILFETLIKTWNDYIRDYKLPFKSIDLTDVKGITEGTSSSDPGEGPSNYFDESHLDRSPERRQVPIEQVDEQLFFDYFREHVENSWHDPPLTSWRYREENLHNLAGESIGDIKGNDKRKKYAVYCTRSMESIVSTFVKSSEGFVNSGGEALQRAGGRLDLDGENTTLTVTTEKRLVNRNQQEISSPDLNSEEINITHKEKNNYAAIYDVNASPKLSELILKKSDTLSCLEDGMIRKNYICDLISEKKTAGLSSTGFSVEYSLQSVCPGESLFKNFIEFEKERITSNADIISNNYLENISSGIENVAVNTSSAIGKNEPVIIWGSDIAIYRDFCTEDYVQGIEHCLHANMNKESGNDDRSKKQETSTNHFGNHCFDMRDITAANGIQNSNTVNVRNICFEKELNDSMEGEFRTDFQGLRIEDKSLTNNSLFKELREFDPLFEEVQSYSKTPIPASDTGDEGTDWLNLPKKTKSRDKSLQKAKSKRADKFISQLLERRRKLLCNKDSSVVSDRKHSGDLISQEESKYNNCPSDKTASTMKLGDKLDAKKCFQNVDNYDKQEPVINEESDQIRINHVGRQLTTYSSNTTASDVHLRKMSPDAEEECFNLKQLEDIKCKKHEISNLQEVQNCGNFTSSYAIAGDGTGNTEHEVKDNSLAWKSQCFDKVSKLTFNERYSEFSILPQDATRERKVDDDFDSQNAESDRKWNERFPNFVAFGRCSECVEKKSPNGDIEDIDRDSSKKTSRKGILMQKYYKDRLCRSKSKIKRDGTTGKSLMVSKRADKPLELKRVTFREDNSVLSYDPEESVFETFWRKGIAQKVPRCTSKNKDRSIVCVDPPKNHTNLKKKTYKSQKRSVSLTEHRKHYLYDVSNQSTFENFDEVTKDEVKGQDNENDRDYKETEAIKSGAKDPGGYINAAFVDIPVFDCIPDLERTNSESISATFDEDEKLLTGERTSTFDKPPAIPLNLTEMSRHAECNMKRWIRDSLLARKRLSFTKMKSTLLNK